MWLAVLGLMCLSQNPQIANGKNKFAARKFLKSPPGKIAVIAENKTCFYTPVERTDYFGMPWPCPSNRPSDILKTACQINVTFYYGLNTTKTSDAIEFWHSMKTKMAAKAV